MHFSQAVVSTIALLAGSALAHPGHDIAQEMKERRDFLQMSARSDLSHCAAKLKARGLEDRNVKRRAAQVAQARRRALKKRDAATVLATDHNMTSLGYTANTDSATLFSSNGSCVLTPEVTQGPYYVGGELIREDIRETQAGIDLFMDYQVVDVATCEPVPNVYVEIWHCNATGVYSGVVASGNGVSSDTSNINTTYLRGIQETDADGVAKFTSIVPGHYTGRANHIHVLVHTNVTHVYDNQTLGNSVTASHVGQTFFDQDMLYAAEAYEPYSSNTQDWTLNTDDSILSQEAATDGVDPLMDYTYLTDDVSDGIFAWISFGINSTLTQTVTPASFYYATGGEANPNSGMGGGGDAPPSS